MLGKSISCAVQVITVVKVSCERGGAHCDFFLDSHLESRALGALRDRIKPDAGRLCQPRAHTRKRLRRRGNIDRGYRNHVEQGHLGGDLVGEWAPKVFVVKMGEHIRNQAPKSNQVLRVVPNQR